MNRLTIFIWLLAAAMTGSSQTLALKECIRLGIERNLSLANTRIDITKARTAVTQNRARLLPVINGVFQFTDYLKQPVNVTTGTLLGNDFPDDPTWQTIRSMQYNASTGVRLDVPVYNRSIFAGVDVARTVERLSSLSYDKAVEDLTLQIGKVYYLAQLSLEQAALTGENISRMEALLSITEAMYEQGTVLEVDLNRVKINLQNLMTLRNQHTSMYDRQINMLRFLMDMAPETPLNVERMSTDIDMRQAPEISYSLPALKAAGMRKDLTEQKISAVKAGYLPAVSFTGYAGALGYQEKFGHFFHSKDATRNWFGNCFVGISVTVPIFDGNSRKLKIRRLRQEAEQADNSLRLLHDRMNQEYADAMLRLNHNIDVYQTQSLSYRQALDVYRVTEEQYREGVASMTAILQDEMQLRTAQTSCVQAHCSYSLARLDLLHLSGNLSLLTE